MARDLSVYSGISTTVPATDDTADAARLRRQQPLPVVSPTVRERDAATSGNVTQSTSTTSTGETPASKKTLSQVMPPTGATGATRVTETTLPEPTGSTGSTGSAGPTLAKDTFKKTIALMMGAEEAAKPWVDAIYGVASGYYKTGSTIDESLNFSLQDARTNPALKPFADRFKGVFTLQDKLNSGMAVHVPTIAEYTTAQAAIGKTLEKAGLKELATQDFTGDLIGKNFSSLDVADILTNTFSVIQNADPFLKAHFASYGATDTQIAKALLTGDKTGAQLEQELKGAQMSAAAEMQGLKATDPFALAKTGTSYAQAQANFEQIAQNLQPTQQLASIYGAQQPGVTAGNTQQQMEAAKFGSMTPGGMTSAQSKENLKKLYQQELNQFGGSAGVDKSSLSDQSIIGSV
jgi:hypothetical protein